MAEDNSTIDSNKSRGKQAIIHRNHSHTQRRRILRQFCFQRRRFGTIRPWECTLEKRFIHTMGCLSRSIIGMVVIAVMLHSKPVSSSSFPSISTPPFYADASTSAFAMLSPDESRVLEDEQSFDEVPSTEPLMLVSDDPGWNSSLLDGNCSWNGIDDYEFANKTGQQRNGKSSLYEVPVYLVIILSLLYGSISVTAATGNLLVLWVVTVVPRMRTKTNMFIANLALADIIIALFAIPFQFQAALLQRWNLPEFMCAFCPFVQVLSVNVSVFTLSAIALDRYRAIVSPFKAIRFSKRDAIYTVLFIWLLSAVIATPQELDYRVMQQKQDDGSTKPVCAPALLSNVFRKWYIVGLVVFQYLLPLVIISGAYAIMGARLWGSTAPGSKVVTRDENTLRNKKKVVKMLAIVVILFALCWLPLQLYNLFQMITTINEYEYINIIWFCFHWLAMSNSCYNPFIYAIFSDKFQTEFRARLRCRRSQGGRDATEDVDFSETSDFRLGYRARISSSRQANLETQPRRRGMIRLQQLPTHTSSNVSDGHETSVVSTISEAVIEMNCHSMQDAQSLPSQCFEPMTVGVV